MDYQVPLLRRLAIGLHARMLGAGRALDRTGDLAAELFLGLITVGAVGVAGAAWLPISTFGTDVLLWITIWALSNTGLCLLLRWARRRRHGSAPSNDVASMREALRTIASGWLGAVALVVGIHDLSSSRSARGWVVGLIGVALFSLASMIAYRYVTRASAEEGASAGAGPGP